MALGGDEDAVGAVVHQIKVGLRDLNQGDVPVQAAVEGEVGLLGVDVAGAVVHHHPDLPAALGHDLGDVHPEGGEAALVGPQQRVAGVHAGDVVGALELQILPHPGLGLRQRQAVGVGSPVVVGAAVLAVQGVPGVGQGDKLPLSGLRGLGEHGLVD